METCLARLVERHAPQLLDVVGIGPDTAVTLLITVGDNPERLDSEASFAALCGVSPVERSSGGRQIRRLNRGGDRQANAALHRIVRWCRVAICPTPGPLGYRGLRFRRAAHHLKARHEAAADWADTGGFVRRAGWLVARDAARLAEISSLVHCLAQMTVLLRIQ